MEKAALFEVLVGYECNNNCRFCSIDFDKRKFNKSTGEVKQDILHARESGAEILGFTGGEPTIRKDIIELAEFAKEQGFRTVRVQTNGRMFSDKEFAKKVIGAGVNYFKFTLNGHTPEIHDFLSQVPGSFEQTIAGIKNVKALGRTVEINILINKQNYKFLPRMVKFLMDLGVSRFTMIFPSYIGNALNYKDDVVVSLSNAVPYIKEAIDIVEEHGLDKAVTVSIPPCFMIGYEKFSASELSPMRTKIRGPGFAVNLDDKIRDEKKKCRQCSDCRYDLICAGVRIDYVDLFGCKEVKPVAGKKIKSVQEIRA